MTQKNHIAIAGAGIGGLAAATALAQAGERVVIYDQFDQPRPVGSGLVIQPVGLNVLHQLGAGAAALAMGTRIHRMLGHEARGGHRVLDVHYDRPGGARFGLGIHRAALFQILLDAAIRAGAELVTGHRVTGQQNRRLSFTGRPDAGPFRMIIDASGAASPLSQMRARSLGYGALWATVDWPQTDLPRDELRQIYRRASHMLGVLPVGTLPGSPAQKAAIFWSLPAASYQDWCEGGLAQWHSQATALWPDYAAFAQQITAPEQMTMARYSHGTLRRPWGDGVVHIGDSAHRASPQLGQGANMALLDAWALVVALQEARGDDGRAMQLYARARRWHVRVYQAMSWAFTPQYQSDSRVLPLLRDRLFFPMSLVPPMPAILSRLVCGDLLPPSA
jgi:2-polyprenyl-6-methoxyphenol hydroxylase-like FAD-dependent oxidoreductase